MSGQQPFEYASVGRDGFRFTSVGKLNSLQTFASGVRLNNTRPIGHDNPSQHVANSISNDINSLKGLTEAELSRGLTVCTKAALQAKRSFGGFPDSVIANLARRQPDLTTKVQVFAALNDPKVGIGLIDDVIADISKPSGMTSLSELKAASHATATLYDKAVRDDYFQSRAILAGSSLLEGSYALMEPHYLTNIALESNNKFLPAATDLVAKSGDAIEASRLLTHKNGWLSKGYDEAETPVELLTSTVVESSSLSELERLAGDITDSRVNDLITKKLAEQAKEDRYDLRLERYLQASNTPLSEEVVTNIHATLVRNKSKMNTLPSQNALLRLLDRSPSDFSEYDVNLLRQTIDVANNDLEHYKQFNVDKTLIEVSEAALIVSPRNQGEAGTEIYLSELTNEQLMKDMLDDFVKHNGNSLSDYDIQMKFSEDTTPLIKELLEQQVRKSMANQPNDLDRLMMDTVQSVVRKLDSRIDIQERIEAEAALSNKDNLAKKVSKLNVINNYDSKNSVAHSGTTLSVDIDGEVKYYSAADFDTFDTLALRMYKDAAAIDDSVEPKITAIHEDRVSYLSKTFDKDFNDYLSKPNSDSIYKLNQHWTHNIEQFVDSRNDLESSRLEIKNALNNNNRRDTQKTGNSKVAP